MAFKLYTEARYLKLHTTKLPMTRLTPKLHSLMILVSPKSLKCNISMNNDPIAHNSHGKFRAIKGKYAQIRVIKPKYSQL